MASLAVRQSPQTFLVARRQHASGCHRWVMIRETKPAARCTNLPNIAASVTSIQCFCSVLLALNSQPAISIVRFAAISSASLTICASGTPVISAAQAALFGVLSLLSDTLQTADYPVVYFPRNTLSCLPLLSSGYAQSLTSVPRRYPYSVAIGGIIAKEFDGFGQIGSMAITGLPDFFSADGSIPALAHQFSARAILSVFSGFIPSTPHGCFPESAAGGLLIHLYRTDHMRHDHLCRSG